MTTRGAGWWLAVMALMGLPRPRRRRGRRSRSRATQCRQGSGGTYAGKEIERIVSPVDGCIMYGLAGPPVRAGEAVVTIGIPATTPP